MSIVAFLLVAAGLLAASSLPLPVLQARVESLVPGQSLALTEARFSAFRDGCRLAAAMFLFIATVIFGYRRQIPRQYKQLLLDRSRAWGIWKHEIGSYFADPWTLWPFLAVFLLGFVLRLAELSRPVELDEAFSYFSYWAHPLYWGLSDYSSSNNHLFHTFLVFLSRHLVGDTLTALRLPALVGGLLMMPAAFAVTAELYNRSAAIAATALVACAPPFIDFSGKARGYTWQCFLLLLVAWFACRIGRQEATRFDWLGFVLASALSMYNIPTSVLPFVSIVLWLMLIGWRRGGWNGLLTLAKPMIPALLSVMVLVMLLFFPPLIVSGPEAIFANRFVLPMGRAEFLAQTPALAQVTWVRWNEGVPLLARVFIYAGFVLGLAAHRKIARHAVRLAPLMILFCAAFITVRRVHIYSRVWLFLWLFSLITAGAGMAFALSKRWLVAVFAVVLTAAVGIAARRQGALLWSTESGNVQGLAEAAAWMDQNLDSQDRIVASPLAGPPLDYLTRRRWPRLESQIECATSGLPMCGSRATSSGREPRRIVAIIAKQPAVDDGHARDAASWNLQELDPSIIMFRQHDRRQYSEPKIVRDQVGITIWEAWNLAVNMPDRHSQASENGH
jgi:hypothetical protein